MRKLFLIVFTFLKAVLFAQDGNPPFYNDIQKFKQQDSLNSPAKKSILFIGSSSFTKWTDVKGYFPGYPILNRGFGGSTLSDLIRYVDDIVVPYKPKQVVIYCGENDIASSDTITAETVAQRFVTLFETIRKVYPKVQVDFISMKPSPSRERFLPKLQSANQQIKDYIATQKRAAYIDVYPYMMHEDGHPRKALFVEDMLHMNKSGYAIWQYAILPYLKK
ncbi:MAG: G-D-S-L family lipolytic protein [Chitinophagaceae bacterium]|nr:G-D-S-L family lipolytic protein [Chitinophagaceae bacterium]